MGSDGETTIRAPAVQAESLPQLLSIRLLFEPENDRARPAVPLGRVPFTIGRSIGERGILLKDPRASRIHATLHPRGEAAVRIVDSSSNGTYVNGERIDEPRDLSDGDIIRVGDSILLVRVGSAVPARDADIPELEGRHVSMRQLRHTISSVAPTDAKVLIIGESGTGKELVARAIHERSGREGRFVAVNCGAIPEALAESQLFGHVQGAFTGANKAHDGFMRAAMGGTLFLDEIGELSPVLQPKLLRALAEQKVIPVGATEPLRIDVRLIAATHRDLLHEVDEGSFRGDLYARIAGYLVHTLPLRDRTEDILPLLRTFLGSDVAPVEADLAEALLLHPFRFNVRELKEIATQLRIDGAGLDRLPLSLVSHRLTRRAASTIPPPITTTEPRRPLAPPRPPPPEKEELMRLMEEHAGNVSRVANALGRSRRQIYRYLERYGLVEE
ncbi:MAG: sigma 54-interacting transcriptional regulator [Sandaracinaceae bacterium]